MVRHELIKRLHERFNQEGIEINYPVRKLVMPSAAAGIACRRAALRGCVDAGLSLNQGEVTITRTYCRIQ